MCEYERYCVCVYRTRQSQALALAAKLFALFFLHSWPLFFASALLGSLRSSFVGNAKEGKSQRRLSPDFCALLWRLVMQNLHNTLCNYERDKSLLLQHLPLATSSSTVTLALSFSHRTMRRIRNQFAERIRIYVSTNIHTYTYTYICIVYN